MKITEISIKRPTIVVVVLTVLTMLGFLSYKTLNYELLPKFSTPIVTISTVYPGASPYEVENTVTRKIEDAVSSMENLKKIISNSVEGVSIVMVELNENADPDLGLQDAQRKVNAILSQLPEDVKTPSLNKISLDDLPIMTISAAADVNDKEFYDLIKQRIQPALSRVPGVAQINLIGGQEREIHVNIDAARLEAYKISLLQVRQAIINSNMDFPTGKIKTSQEQVLVRLSGKYRDLEQLRKLVVSSAPEGGVVRLEDIAEVTDAQKDVDLIARVDLKNAITLKIQKQSDANAVKVSEGIRDAIAQLEKDYSPVNLKMPIVQDSSIYTLESADAVIFDLILAIALVAVVMLLFLHSIRNAFIVMVAIPASLIATFIGIKMFGFTLNLMSLLGLSLVVGILVDDAIVVLENIYRHMEMGKNKVRAAYDGVTEIGFTVLSITMVIVVVFLPITFTSGLVSNILTQFCVVVVIATLLSMAASFSIVPWLSSRFGKLEHLSNKTFFGRFLLGFEKGLDNFTQWITGILRWSLRNKTVTLVITLALLFASFMLIGKGYIGGEFIPAGDRGEFIVQVELPKDASIEETSRITRQVEEHLRKKREVTMLISTVGQSSEGFGASQTTPYKGEVHVQLIEKKLGREAADIFAARMKKELSAFIVGAEIKTTPVSIMGTADRAPIELIVIGPSLDSVLSFAEKAKAELAQIEGANQLKLTVEDGNPEVNVEVNRDKMAALGLSMEMVGATMQTAFNGSTDAKYRDGEYEYDINIRFGDFNRQNIEDVKNISFINARGEKIALSQFADVSYSAGPSKLERRDRSTSVSVQAQVIGRTSGTVNAEFTERLEKLERPAGVAYIFGGDAEMQGDSFGALGIALLISVALVYLIMVALYDSYVYPLVVMFSIPLSIIGALLALALSNSSLNIFTILGLIMLIGLVAKNAILLVDFTNHMKERGESTDEALVHANNARLRPILMTTIAMIIGMLPIALSSGSGAEWKNGLAWTIIGGLTSSMFLTLIVVPVIYKIFDSILTRLGLNKHQKESINELMTAPYTPNEDAPSHP